MAIGTDAYEIFIQPARGWIGIDLREFWRYRELLLFLVWRDIKVRYKQTLLGASWAIIQPLFTMVVFTIFFGNLARIPSDNIPYPIFSFAALVAWTFFANALQQSSNSLAGNTNLLTKIYFPRLILPVASAMAGLVDLLLTFVVLIGLMLVFGIVPTLNVIWIPVFVVIAFITALGVGFWLSTLQVWYRDVRYIVPFLIQFWLFATPVVYPSSLVKEPWRTLYGLNPMTGVIE